MSIIEIKVTLQDIEPAVTRTLQVPADIRLDRLHLTLQVAMGWTNSHLYMFEAARATWGIADPDFGGEDLPANKTTLGQVIEDTGKKTINYIYDFGDNWEHRIKIGRITDPVPGELYPRLIEVTGKCPPEDVGGFPGYYGFLDAMAAQQPARTSPELRARLHSARANVGITPRPGALPACGSQLVTEALTQPALANPCHAYAPGLENAPNMALQILA